MFSFRPPPGFAEFEAGEGATQDFKVIEAHFGLSLRRLDVEVGRCGLQKTSES